MPCMRTFFNGTVTVSGMNVLIKNRKKKDLTANLYGHDETC